MTIITCPRCGNSGTTRDFMETHTCIEQWKTDLSIVLGDYRREITDRVVASDFAEEETLYEDARDAAVELLVTAGYWPDSPDQLGVPISQDAHTLLHLAIYRAPQLAILIDQMLNSR